MAGLADCACGHGLLLGGLCVFQYDVTIYCLLDVSIPLHTEILNSLYQHYLFSKLQLLLKGKRL